LPRINGEVRLDQATYPRLSCRFDAPLYTHGAQVQVSRSAYYARLHRTQTTTEKDDIELTTIIHSLFKKSRATYGTRRIRKALCDQQRTVSRRRISRLMVKANLACKTKRKFKVTTDSKHDKPISPNLLDREFNVNQPDQVYVGDITYIYTQEGWLSLKGFPLVIFGGRD